MNQHSVHRLLLPLFLALAVTGGSAMAATQTWTNTPSGTASFNSGASWLSGTAPAAGDIATFAATGTAQPVLNSSLSIGQLFFSTTTSSGYDLTGSGTLTLTSVGSTQATAAIGSAQTNSGTNIIDTAIVLGAAAGATQTFSQSGTGTLVLNGVIASTNALGSLTYANSGTYAINGANTYTGTTTVSGGATMVFGNKSALGNGTLNTTSSSNTFAASTNLTGANKIANNINTTSNFGIGVGSALEFGGDINLNGALRQISISNTAAATTFGGAFTNDGGLGLRLVLTGTTFLTGTNSSFTGTFEFRGTPQLVVSSIGMSGSNSSIGAGNTIKFGSANTSQANLRYVGTGDTTDRTVDLASTTGGISIAQEGTGLLKFTHNLTVSGSGNKIFTLQGSTAGTGEISGNIIDGAVGSVISLVKTGTGQWTLSGSNSYSGGTTINGGVLAITNKNALGTGGLSLGTSTGTSTILATTALTGANAIANNLTAGAAGPMIIGGSNDMEFTGTVFGSANTTSRTLTINNTGSTTFSGPVFITSGTGSGVGLTINGSGVSSINGAIANSSTTGSLSTLTYAGSGKLTLSGTNTFTGGLTVSSGTLSVGSINESGTAGVFGSGTSVTLGSAANVATLEYTGASGTTGRVFTLGSSTGTGTLLVSNASTNLTLNTNGTILNSVGGSGVFVKAGSGTLSLTGTNNGISGPATFVINQGVVNAAHSGAGGASNQAIRSINTIINNSGTLLLGTGGNGDQIISTGTVTVNSGGVFDLNGLNEGIGSLANTDSGGVITNNAGIGTTSQLATTNGVTYSFGGRILDGATGGTVSLQVSSGAFATLSGSNTYSGPTAVTSGTLSVSSINSVSGTAHLAASNLGAPTTIANGTIGLGTTSATGVLVYTGAGETTDRVVNMLGTTGGAILDQSGSGLLKFTSDLTATGVGTKTLTLRGSTAGTGEISGAIVNSSPANVTSVLKTGSGTWTLSGQNTYTGSTSVSAGTLLINGTVSGSSAVTVASGATLGGSGTVGGSVGISSGGILSPGNSPGILSTGNLTLAGTLAEQLGKSGGSPIAGTDYDQTNVTGTVTLTGGDLTLTLLGGTQVGDKYFIILNDSTDAVTGIFASLNGVSTDLSQNAFFTFGGQQFQISYTADSSGGTFLGGNDVALQAVPEPQTFALVGLGLTALLWRAKKRRLPNA